MSAQLHDAIGSPARLDALLRLRLLDTPPEEPFDRLTQQACRLLGSSIALVSLVDDHRQFFKSAWGLPIPCAAVHEAPLPLSFCRQVVTSGLPLVVENANEHPLGCGKAAIEELDVVAYLGMPLTTPHGAVLGSFCVIDSQPRKWTAADQQTMSELAASVMSEIALRSAHDEMLATNLELLREAGERESLLKALVRSEARLRAAQRLTGVGSFVLHELAVRENHWSDEALRILQITDAEAPSSVFDFVENLVYPDDRATVVAAIERALNFNKICQIEYRVCKPGGGTNTLLTTIETEINGEDSKTALFTVMDVTERNQADTILADVRSEMYHLARVATAGEMAAIVAHEINQPLTAIAHTANACHRLSVTDKLARSDLIQHLADISTQAKRASEIVRQITRYVSKQAPKQRPLPLDKVVSDILSMLSPMSKKYSIKISCTSPSDLPRVLGDETQLGQLVLNLVRNAFDAVAVNPASDRSVTITMGSTDRMHVVLEVADNGPGIPADLHDKIFTPFFTTRRNGLGMGLSVSRTIAEGHHAILSARDRDPNERGACFQVTFLACNQ
jgi:signal transduction histidine kinase